MKLPPEICKIFQWQQLKEHSKNAYSYVFSIIYYRSEGFGVEFYETTFFFFYRIFDKAMAKISNWDYSP